MRHSICSTDPANGLKCGQNIQKTKGRFIQHAGGNIFIRQDSFGEVARGGIDRSLQEPVDRGGFLSGHLRQPLGRPSRGGSQETAQLQLMFSLLLSISLFVTAML